MVSKKELRPLFEKDWEKHYKVPFLEEQGFQRKHCGNCRRAFWTIDSERKLCNDPSCEDYSFIGERTTRKKLDYLETWREIEKYFTKNGHSSIQRYPVTARWRDDLFFTSASIIGFQPYVVSGEIDPPANPLVVPQRCLRFNDIPNVGVTGRHMTNFVMIGQHAFNSEKTGLFYWKDETLRHDYNVLTDVLGIAPEKITFREDAWAGGGNFGPCIEYFVHGLELGNAVFMQYADPTGELKDSYELKMKVVDMGAGLERFAWIVNSTPTAYDAVYGDTLKEAKKQAGLHVDEKLFTAYSRLAGRLDFEEVGQEKVKAAIAKELGVEKNDLYGQIEPLQAVYAIIDHLGSIMFTTTDGTLPSNTGAGYYLRYLLRRAFSLQSENSLALDFAKIVETHARYMKPLNPELSEFVPTVCDLIEVEKGKYKEMLSKARVKVLGELDRLARENIKEFPEGKLVELYESHGVPVELVKQVAKEEHSNVLVPEINIEAALQKKTREQARKDQLNLNQGKAPGIEGEVPKTKFLYYDDPENQYKGEFDARVLAGGEGFVVLDENLFYAEGGGQEGDHGKLDGAEVVDVQKSKGVAFHYVKGEAPAKGEKVHGVVDWKRRERLMKHHSANHVLLAAAKKVLGGHVWQTGAHKAEEKGHLDLTHYKRVTDEEVREIEELANKAVEHGYECEVKWWPRGEAEKEFGFVLYQGGAVPGKMLRVVNFKGWDAEACGGTHVRNSKDIQVIKVTKRIGVQDGRERLEYVAGTHALEWMKKALGERLEGVEKMTARTEGGKIAEKAREAIQKSLESLSAARKPTQLVKQFNNSLREVDEAFNALNEKASAAEKEQGKKLQLAGKKIALELVEKAEKVKGARVVSAFLDGIGVPMALEAAKEVSTHPGIAAVIACTHPSEA